MRWLLLQLTTAAVAAPGPTSASCAACHEPEAEAWAASRHAHAFDNPMFQASYAMAPLRSWCRTCHRPEDRDEVGVGCVTCHVVDGVVQTTGPVSAWGAAEHPMATSPTLSTSAFCGRCHQFAGPTEHDPTRLAGDPVQDTLEEWRAVGSESRCQDCHLPDGDHGLPGAHNPAMVRSALEAVVTHGPGGLQLQVTATDALGHRIPTGDPFRRLELEACADAACATVLGRRSLGVTHQFVDGVMRVVHDTRLAPGDRVTWPLPPASRHWRVRLAYGDLVLDSQLPPDEIALVVDQGPVPDRGETP